MLRGTTAVTMDMSYPTWQLMLGGVGTPKMQKQLLPVDAKLPFEQLMAALGSEGARWKESIITLTASLDILTGDVLLAAAFVSYIGCFNKRFRKELMEKTFVPYLDGTLPAGKGGVPMSEGIPDPIKILTTDAQIAGWQREGLPADRLSVEKLARYFIRTFKDVQIGKKAGNIKTTLGADLQALTDQQVFRFPSTLSTHTSKRRQRASTMNSSTFSRHLRNASFRTSFRSLRTAAAGLHMLSRS